MDDPLPGERRPAGPDRIPLEEIAAYIAQMSGELAQLAGRARWPLLTYLLNMARIEAESRLAADNGAAKPAPKPAAKPAGDRVGKGDKASKG